MCSFTCWIEEVTGFWRISWIASASLTFYHIIINMSIYIMNSTEQNILHFVLKSVCVCLWIVHVEQFIKLAPHSTVNMMDQASFASYHRNGVEQIHLHPHVTQAGPCTWNFVVQYRWFFFQHNHFHTAMQKLLFWGHHFQMCTNLTV